MKQRIIIYDRKSTINAAATISALKPTPATPLAIDIDDYKPKRTQQQNKRQWILLTFISQYISDKEGFYHSKEWWNHALKIEYGWIEGTVYVKTDHGHIETPWPKSTSNMNIRENIKYQNQLEEFIRDKGFEFPSE